METRTEMFDNCMAKNVNKSKSSGTFCDFIAES